MTENQPETWRAVVKRGCLLVVALILIVLSILVFQSILVAPTQIQRAQAVKQNDRQQLSTTSQKNPRIKEFPKMTPTRDIKSSDNSFFQFIYQLNYTCKESVRLGNKRDGGWDMCLDAPYRPSKPCLVYSFGINYDFSFDDATSNKFGCTVRSYDPSMKRTQTHRRGPNIWFYKLGISGKDFTTSNGWKLRTLQTLIKENGDDGKIIDYLKADVEGAEWDSLPNFFSTNILDRVKQFGFEIHLRKKSYSKHKFWKILSQLEERGFRRWHSAMNSYPGNVYKLWGKLRSCCYEMVYINTKFMQ